MLRNGFAPAGFFLVRLVSVLAGLVFQFHFIEGTAMGQSGQGEAPVHRVDGSFVREWLVLGPFAAKDIQPDFLAEAGGEAKVRPKEGEVFRSKDGSELRWTRMRSATDMQNLESAIEVSDLSVAYAYCELSSEQALDTYLRVFTSLSGVIWLNGKKVGASSISLGGKSNIAPVKAIQLNGGKNAFLLKMSAQNGKEDFMVQPLAGGWIRPTIKVVDESGKAVGGARIEFYKEGELYGKVETDGAGKAAPCIIQGEYDVRVTSGTRGSWLFGLTLTSDKKRTLEVQLKRSVSIHGKVRAMDRSPQGAIVVQAIRVEGGDFSRVAASVLTTNSVNWATVLSDTNGNFQFINLRDGTYRIRCHGLDGFIDLKGGAVVESGEGKAGLEFVFPETKKGVWKSHHIMSGLKEVHPRALERTADGLIWIGTDESFVYTYDGVEFKVAASAPQVPANEVRTIKEGVDGAIWIGTSAGIARYANERIERFALPNSGVRNQISDIVAEKEGTVWFASEAGLYKYDGRAMARAGFKEGASRGSVNSLLRGRDGSLWIGSSTGLLRYDGKTFKLLQPFGDFSGRGVEHLHEAKNGAIWFTAQPGGGAYRYDGRKFTRIGEEHGLLSDEIHDIAETSDGTIWFATAYGLSRYNGRTIVNYTEADGLSNRWVRDLFVDSDDVIWCANGWGISRFDPNGFIGFAIRDGLMRSGGGPAEVFAILPEADGNVLLGTGWRGVFRIDGKTLSPTDFGFGDDYVRQIRRGGDGTLWFGTSAGISKLQGGRAVKVLERKWILALCIDGEGNVWYGDGWQGSGVTRYNTKSGEEITFGVNQGLPDQQVWALEPSSKGGVWIGTGGGLAHYKEGKIETIAGLKGSGGVFHLRSDENDVLWITSRDTVEYLKGTQPVRMSPTNTLPGQHIWSSTRTRDGKIWMATERYGLLGYDGKAVTMLDKRDGMVGNSVFSLLSTGEDGLWVGFLDGGMTRYKPSKLRPSIRLQGMVVDNQTITNIAKPPRLTAGRRVSFQYQEIDQKTHPDKRQFWYRLVNQAGETVVAAVTRNRRFEWVPEKKGSYTFEVQAIDRDLNYSEPARVILQVLVPWHANPWVLIPSGIAVGGLLIWAFVVRALYLRKSREAVVLQERVRLARDLHDNLGAGLTHLAMVGDLVRDKIDEPAAVQVLAGRLTESARALTRTMGEIIWATDPEKDTLASFALFLTRYAERFFADSELRLRFDIPAELPDIMIPGQVRNSLFLVAKEALNNMAKHADASELRIKLELVNRDLHLTFEDDGCGFEKGGDSTGHGLENMQKRLRDLGGELQIESATGKGTRIYARVRLPK